MNRTFSMILILGKSLSITLGACGSVETDTPIPKENKVDKSIQIDTDTYIKTESPNTKSELESDPTAPSKNPYDYDSEGQYVPETGPSDNAEDYDAYGKYKPIEDMTEEEIKAELEKMFYDN